MSEEIPQYEARYAKHYALVRNNHILVDRATGLLEIYEHREQAEQALQPDSDVLEIVIARSPQTLAKLSENSLDSVFHHLEVLKKTIQTLPREV